MGRKSKSRNRRSYPKRPPRLGKTASRSGSNAGRGFRYQDAVSVCLAVEIWAGRRAPAILIPEGGDDVELRGEESTFVQVKSRRDHLGNYSQGAAAEHIRDLWDRSLASSPQPDRMELVLERNVVGLSPGQKQPETYTIKGSIAKTLAGFNTFDDLRPKTSISVSISPQESAY